ncbi:mucin-17-like [Penaeus monodon]|uniref:mucin-17-like n=1 Tax=Penaeus monodon TaxID=6687 RepID=UPI0018A7D604|nr:mucin-17-like [Penaeus monodon]
MDSLPSTSKIFPEDVKHNLLWYQHSDIVETEHSASSDRPDVIAFPSHNPEQWQSNKPQHEQMEPFDLSITNFDQEYTIKNKLEDQNQKFTERNPHQGHYAQLVTPPSNATSGEALWVDQNAHTPMTAWSSQNKLPLSATSFLQPQPSSSYDSATAVITTSKQIPNIVQGAERSSTNIQSHSLSQPSKLQPAPAETALDTPLCFPSPSSSNTSPFGVSPSSYVNTDGISKEDSELVVTGADEPTMETECAEMLKINNGKEANSHVFYKDSSSFVTSAAFDQQFTNSSCEGYVVPHTDSLPSTSKGYPEDVIHGFSWNLHSEGVQNYHSTSFGRPGDVRVFQSTNPKQYQHELQEPFDIPVIDLDQEETNKDKLDKDQNQKFTERNPHQGHYAQLVTPPSNATSGEALWVDQNAHTPMTAWSSQNKLPLSATSFLQPQPSSLYDSIATVITSKQIPNTVQGAERSSTNIQNHFVFQPGKPKYETELGTPLCFPSPSPVSTTEDQINTSPYGISPSSYDNTNGIGKNDGGCTVTGTYDPSRKTSTRQELHREESVEMQNMINGKEKNDAQSPEFSADSSSFGTSAMTDPQNTNASFESYEVPNIDCLPSASKGFPENVKHSETDHAASAGGPDVIGFPSINPEQYQVNKPQHEQTEPFDLSINDLDQEGKNKNKFDGDQKLRLSEDCHQDRRAQLVNPTSNSTSGGALELEQNAHNPITAWSSQNNLSLSATSLLQLQPSSPYDSTATVITSKEIPETIQRTEGSSMNIHSHSLSQQSRLQPAPTETALGTPLCFPSPSSESTSEDQTNTSPFGVSLSSYVNTDGIINKDGGLKMTVDNDTSVDANTREESNGGEVSEYNDMQRVIRGEERSDTYSTAFNTDSSSSAISAIDQYFIKSSSKGYIPDVSSLQSTSKEAEHNLHSESIENNHATKKNQFDTDPNQKFSEGAPNQGQNAQLVTPPSSSTSGEVLGLAQNSSTSLLEPQPAVITTSKEMPTTVQGDEGSNTNIQSHSLSQQSKLQPAPTETALGTPLCFPSPSSVSTTEDQTNTSPFGVSPSSYTTTEGINKECGLKVTVDNDTSVDANTREESNREVSEYNDMQRVIRGEERSDTYSTAFNTDSSSSATSAIDQYFIKSSSKGYIPNVSSLQSTSKEFPKEAEHNLHSESIENNHATNKNQFDTDPNQKFSEGAPNQGQNAQLVTPPSSSTSGEVLGLAQNSATSLLEPQPSSVYESSPAVITSSEEMPTTVQGDEGSNTNIQSHSLSQPSKPQPAPTETALGTPISFPSPSSATEDQMNTSPFGVSPSSYVNTDEISKEDSGITETGADDPSMERSPRQKLNREGVLEPIQTKILKYKNGRKRMFMVLQRSSFELMKDKGLIQPVKAFPNGQIMPVTKDEIECSKTLLPPTHQPEDIEKIQYKSITQLEDLEELPDSLEDIRKLPTPSSYESQHPLQAPQRSFSPFTLEWSDNSFLTPTIKQTPVVVSWSATSVTDSPALTFTIQLPSKINNSSFTLHSASINSKQSNILPSVASNNYALPPRSTIRPQLSTEIPSTSSLPLAPYTNQPPSIDAQDLSQMHDMYPPSPSTFDEWDQDVSHYSSKESKVLKISDKGISERQNLVRKNILWLPNKEGTSELMEEDVKQLAENARSHYKDFEATKLQLKKKYNRLLSKHSQKYNGLLKKYRHLERTCDIVEDAGSREQILRDAKKFLSEEHAMFLESQMFLKNRAGKGNRFSKKFLKYVIGLYERSPAGYRFLRTIFTMPSVRTIHKWQNHSYQNAETGMVNQDKVMEMSGTYGDIESFADMLQMGPMTSGNEQTEMSNAESFQELINVPPTDFYENNDALFWDDSQVGFEVPQQFVQPQEQAVQSGCEVEYIQNVDDAYMLTQL